MAKLSNTILTTVNIITTIVSIIAISTFVYLHFINGSPPTHCQRMLELPLLIFGTTLFIVSFLGLLGSCCRFSGLLWIYLVLLVGFILGWFIFSVFVFFVTNKGVSEAVSGVGFREYKVNDYSDWLQKRVGNNWGQIRSCLFHSRVCKFVKIKDHHLSPIQSGCCKPPIACGFSQKNGTYWEVPKTGPISKEADCETWNNDQNKLCYDCTSCKAGVLANVRKEWRKFLLINVIIIIILFLIYMIGCCAVRNNYRLPSKYRSGYP